MTVLPMLLDSLWHCEQQQILCNLNSSKKVFCFLGKISNSVGFYEKMEKQKGRGTGFCSALCTYNNTIGFLVIMLWKITYLGVCDGNWASSSSVVRYWNTALVVVWMGSSRTTKSGLSALGYMASNKSFIARFCLSPSDEPAMNIDLKVIIWQLLQKYRKLERNICATQCFISLRWLCTHTIFFLPLFIQARG